MSCGGPGLSCGVCAGALDAGGCCSTCGANEFTLVTPEQIQTTLVASLTGVVDSITDLYTQFGVRQYRISLVWTRWVGGERGVGQEIVLKECPILPTPSISDLINIETQVLSIGTQEVGELTVDEISPRYNEDLLRGQDIVVRRGDPLPDDISFYYEITFPTPGGAQRRRFVPNSAPNKAPDDFAWSIKLVRAAEDRSREGEPQ